MGILDFINPIKAFAGSAESIIKIFKESPGDKNAQELALMRLQLAAAQAERDTEQVIEQETTKRLTSFSAQIETEIKSDDNYTKRARPTWLYALIGIAVNALGVIPLITAIKTGTPMVLNLPYEYWAATIASFLGYSVLRSIYDKRGLQRPTLLGLAKAATPVSELIGTVAPSANPLLPKETQSS